VDAKFAKPLEMPRRGVYSLHKREEREAAMQLKIVKRIIVSVCTLSIVAGIAGALSFFSRDRWLTASSPSELKAHTDLHKERLYKTAVGSAEDLPRHFEVPPPGKTQTDAPPQVNSAKGSENRAAEPKSEYESAAAAKFKEAKELLQKREVGKAKERLEGIIATYPDSQIMKDVIELYNSLK
jgi:hypothetical protein